MECNLFHCDSDLSFGDHARALPDISLIVHNSNLVDLWAWLYLRRRRRQRGSETSLLDSHSSIKGETDSRFKAEAASIRTGSSNFVRIH